MQIESSGGCSQYSLKVSSTDVSRTLNTGQFDHHDLLLVGRLDFDLDKQSSIYDQICFSKASSTQVQLYNVSHSSHIWIMGSGLVHSLCAQNEQAPKMIGSLVFRSVEAFPYHRFPWIREGRIVRPSVSSTRSSRGITLSNMGVESLSSSMLGP